MAGPPGSPSPVSFLDCARFRHGPAPSERSRATDLNGGLHSKVPAAGDDQEAMANMADLGQTIAWLVRSLTPVA